MYELDDFRGQFISTGSPGRPEYIWSRERKFDVVACEQQRRRPACASTQFDQRLCSSLILKFEIFKLASCKMTAFWLVYVAEHVSFNVRQHFWVHKTIASFRR